MFEPASAYLQSNSLIGGSKNLSNRSSNSLIDSNKVDAYLNLNKDVVDPRWSARHAKAIYKLGFSGYDSLAHKARKYGRDPRAYMAKLINNELGRLS